MKLKQNFVCCRYNFCKLAKISSLLLMVVGILFVLCPASQYNNDANAADTNEYLEVTTKSDINLDVMAGEMSVAKDSVTVSTGSVSGYKLFLSTKSSTTNTIVGGPNSASRIFATSGTFSEPAAIKNEEGSVWGYAVAGLNNFDSSYDTTEPSESSKFAAVPTKDNDQLIKDQPNSVLGEVTTIYYGVKTDGGLKSGTYSTELLYTVIVDAASLVGGEIGTLTPEAIFENYSEEYVEIQTSFATNAEDLGVITATIDNLNCSNVEVINNAPVTIRCKVPSGLTFGKKDVQVSLQKFGKTYEKAEAFNVKQVMQMITPERCRNLTLNEQYEAKDIRDDKVYYIAKLADGNCWMTQNLDLDLSAEQTLTSNDTDLNVLGAGYTQEGGVLSWTPTNSTYAGTSLTTTTSPASATDPVSWDPGEYEITNGKGTSACTKTNLSTCAAATNVVASTTEPQEANHYKIGNYYNWPAALASNALNTDAPSVALNTVENSICPSGWRLPRAQTSTMTAGTSSLDASLFGNLLYAQGIITVNTANTYATNGAANIVSDPLYLIFAGNVSDQTVYNIGTSGQYWTSTSSDSNTGYGIFLNAGSSINLSAQHHRKVLHNVRCVIRSQDTLTYDGQGGNNVPAAETKDMSASGSTFIISSQRPTKVNNIFLGWDEDPNATTPTYRFDPATEAFVPETITTLSTTLYAIWSSCNPSATTISDAICMQDMNASVKTSMVTDQQYELIDVRDGKPYYISKLIDDNVWMTQNLDTSLSTNNPLTSDSTDINVVFSSTGYETDGGRITWTPSKETTHGKFVLNNSAPTAWRQNNANIENVWDPGNYYIPDGGATATAACGSADLSSCVAKTNVVSEEPIEGGRHYHVGNYYNWAATVLTSAASTDYPAAGSANYTVTQNSICPKGWKLPNASLDTTTNGVLADYLIQRGIISSAVFAGTGTAAVTAANMATLFYDPSYFIFAGYISTYTAATDTTAAKNAGVTNVGSQMVSWTSSIYDKSRSYGPYYIRGATNVRPQNIHNRQAGFTVRCIAR